MPDARMSGIDYGPHQIDASSGGTHLAELADGTSASVRTC